MMHFYVSILILFFWERVVSLAYSPIPPEIPCEEIPEGTIVLAPAFHHLKPDPTTRKIRPGDANTRIAENWKHVPDGFNWC